MIATATQTSRQLRPGPSARPADVEHHARIIAAHLAGLVVPEPRSSGLASLLSTRRMVAAIGADGAYFLADLVEAFDLVADPAKLQAIFRPVFVEDRARKLAAQVRGMGGTGAVAVFNRAMVIWERQEMGWSADF